MSSIIPKNEKPMNARSKANRRRRKKRRTEDFSDSSSSSSSSESSESSESENEEVEENGKGEIDVDVGVDVDAVLSDDEMKIDEIDNKDEDFSKIKNKLKTIQLTKTELNNNGNMNDYGYNKINKNINLNQVENIINQNNNKFLENEYLGLMFKNYSDDIDKIRKVPDFNEKSLTILANVLKNGNNIFDEDTLKAVVGK